MRKKAFMFALSLVLVLGLAAGCAQTPAANSPTPAPEAPSSTPTVAPTAEPTPAVTPEPQPADRESVRLGLLKGPTGMGAAKLLADNEAGTSTLAYNVTLGADPANDLVPRLINGELDAAAVPTNLAAALYNKTQGGVKLLALNTLGVLHILEKGDTVHSLADLAGRTL